MIPHEVVIIKRLLRRFSQHDSLQKLQAKALVCVEEVFPDTVAHMAHFRSLRRTHRDGMVLAMSIQSVLLPVFVLIALTFGLLLATGVTRVGAVKSGQVKPKDIALGQSVWPDRIAQVGRAFQNQLETPVLFYVLVVLAILTKKDDLLFVVCEWVFVALRLLHAWIHVGSNNLSRRFAVFVAGTTMLMFMWIVFAIRILAAI